MLAGRLTEGRPDRYYKGNWRILVTLRCESIKKAIMSALIASQRNLESFLKIVSQITVENYNFKVKLWPKYQ
jgi:hypothetical protein